MENNRENALRLAKRIYELDAKVYESSGSELGKTLSGPADRNIDDLALLIMTNPQGHRLRDKIALIGNMARTIPDRKLLHETMIEYNDILTEIESIPSVFGSVDILDYELAAMNSSNRKKISEGDHLIICISRSHGSAGTDIGFTLSENLRINYYDEDILDEILLRREQKIHGDSYARLNNFMKFHGLPKRDGLFFKQSDLICSLASSEDCIFMGRGADAILTNHHIPHVSIFITAPFSARVHRIMEVEHTSMKKAIRSVHKMDRKHGYYYKRFTGRQWGDSNNYDLCINSACYGIDETVELIERMIGREGSHRKSAASSQL